MFGNRAGFRSAVVSIAVLMIAVLLAACTPDPDPEDESRVFDGVPPEAIYEASCASCHKDPQSKAPPLRSMREKSTAAVAFELTNGKMKSQAEGLSVAQIVEVATFITGDKEPYSVSEAEVCHDRRIDFSIPYAVRWGFDEHKSAAVGSEISNLDAGNVASLSLKWVFELPDASDARSQPVVITDTLFIASTSGDLFALDRFTGCIKWHYKSEAPLRTALTLGKIESGPVLFLGDTETHTIAVDARTGDLIWRTDVAVSEFSMLTGAAMTGADNGGEFLIVPVSLYEVPLAADPDHECCRAHGAVHRLDAISGEILWTTHMTEPASPRGVSDSGVQQWGPSGAAVWSTPTIDTRRGLLYVGTGQNASAPGTDLSDSIVAIDLESGEIVWSFQSLAGDTYNAACSSFPVGPNCPKWAGPDFDFGASVILTENSAGKEVLLAGQKSGDVFALDPDASGNVIWRTRIGSGSMFGGIHWGMAVAEGKLFAAANDPEFPIPGYTARPGLYAMDIDTGDTIWTYAPERGCETSMRAYYDRQALYPECSFYYAFSAALSIANDVIFAPALDGKVRAFDIAQGELLWEFNTAQSFDTVSDTSAHGGAMDNVSVQFAGNMVYMQSGYSTFGQLPGNILLAFELSK